MFKYKCEVFYPATDNSTKMWSGEVEAEDMVDAGMALIQAFPLDLDETIISVRIEKIK